MFLKKYVDEICFEDILIKYGESYLNSLDEKQFLLVYNLFKKNKIYFLSNIIFNYLKIFEMDVSYVESKLNYLKEKFGEKYNYIIGLNIKYLEVMLEE